jgi:choline monooxygenase
MTINSELLTQHEIADILKPIGNARTLPRRAFYSREFYDFEVSRLLTNTWMAVSFADQIPDIGDARPLTVLEHPIVLVRNETGTIVSFHNIVPYDGCEVLVRPAAQLTEFVTPYHGLTYDLNGRLTRAAFWNGMESGGDLTGLDCNLLSIRCAVWFGIVFVNLNGSAESFEEYLAPVTDFYADYRLDVLRMGRDKENRPLWHELKCRANWKTMYENYSPNVFHESFVHEMYRKSDHSPRVDGSGGKTYKEIVDERGFIGLQYDNRIAGSFFGDLKSLPAVLRKDGSANPANSIVNVYPNWVVTVLGDHARISFMLPDGPDLCTQYVATFFDQSVVSTEESARDREAAWRLGVQARAEDNKICESIQRARRSPAINSQFFNSFWDTPHYVLTQMFLQLYLGKTRAGISRE